MKKFVVVSVVLLSFFVVKESGALTPCAASIENCVVGTQAQVGVSCRCATCSSGYYVDNGYCKENPEENPVNNCASYNADGDVCMSCDDDYYLDSSGFCFEEIEGAHRVPGCGDLGFTQSVDQCAYKTILRCPQDPDNDDAVYCGESIGS